MSLYWFIFIWISFLPYRTFGGDVFVLSKKPPTEDGIGTVEKPYNSLSYAIEQLTENSTIYLASRNVPYYLSTVVFEDMTYIITIKTLNWDEVNIEHPTLCEFSNNAIISFITFAQDENDYSAFTS